MLIFSRASGTNPVFYQFTPNNGLPSSEIYDIEKDSKGNIWFGTDRGVVKFNGRQFNTYTTKHGLSNNVIDQIIISPAGKIWCIGKDKNLYYLNNEKFHPYLLRAKLKMFAELHNSFYLLDIIFKNEKPEYLVTNTFGILRADELSKSLYYTKTVESTLFYNTKLKVSYFYLDFKHPQYTFGKFNTKLGNNEVTRSKVNYTTTTIRTHSVHKKTGENIVYFDKYLYVLKNGKVLSQVEFKDPILNIYVDSSDNLWVCFFQNGVKKIDAKEHITANAGQNYFSSYIITDVCEDFEGGYWFSTYRDGVFHVPDLSISIIKIPHLKEGEQIGELTGYKNNKLLISTTERRMVILDQNKTKQILTLNPTGLSIISVCNNLFHDSVTNHILASYSDFFYVVKDGEIVFKNRFWGSLKSSIKVNNNIIIAATRFLLFLDEKYNLTKSIYINIQPYVIFNDRQKNIWLGLEEGLAKLVDTNVHFIFQDKIKSRVNAIKQLDNNTIVIGTLGDGLYLIKGNQIVNLKLGNKTQENMINDLDAKGNIIWAATENGIMKISLSDISSPEIRNWSVSNGFPFNNIRKIHLQNNTLYAVAQNKLITMNENNSPAPIRHPFIYLDSATLRSGEKIFTSTSQSFPHYENNITINFHGVAFRSGTHLKYKYRLLGLDTQWKSTPQSFVEFSSLPPGNFTFEVSAINVNNISSVSPVSWNFSIASPFWKKWWFISGLALLFTSIILLLARRKIILERNRNKEREAILQYEQQALSAQINPHFIFNALNSIQNFILKEDQQNAIKYLSRFSKLMRMNLDNAMLKWIHPNNEIKLLEAYLEIEKLRFKNIFRYEINIFDEENKINEILIPSMLIQPFVENSIKHAMTIHSDNQGLISVSLKFEAGVLLCEIEDNGPGINKENKSDKSHISHGMDITIKRLQLLCSEQELAYFFSISDRKHNRENCVGTIVTFNLPYKFQK